jgi:amino acid transporter
MAVDFKSLGKNEQGALVAGGLSIILSFFSRFVSYDLGPLGTHGISAWNGVGTLGVLLVIIATAIVGIKAFAKERLPEGIPWSLAALAAAGLGTIILILKGFTADYGNPGWSGWALFITTIALTAFAFLSFKESGEKIPEINKKDTPPAPPAA